MDFKVGQKVRVKVLVHGAIAKYTGVESAIVRVDSTKKNGEKFYYFHTDVVADPLVYFFGDELVSVEPVTPEAESAEVATLKAALKPFAGIYEDWLNRPDEDLDDSFIWWLRSYLLDLKGQQFMQVRPDFESAYEALQPTDTGDVK